MNLGITGIAHWALKVRDMDRALNFYRDTLGFQEMMRLSNSEGPAEGHFSLIYLRVTNTQFVELFYGGLQERAPDEKATAINHICLQVASIEKTAEALKALGIPLMRHPSRGMDGNNQCWIEDPEGNRIEFMQMLPGNMQEVAIKRLGL